MNEVPGRDETSPGRSRNMAAIRRSETKPERILRAELHRMGFRFRKDYPIVLAGGRVRPDIVFTRRKVAVFVDGCFWHGCAEHSAPPRRNTSYWRPKLARNAERDRRQTALLQSAGWLVVRVWEHDDPAEAASTLAKALLSR